MPLASKAGQLIGAKASSGRMLALYPLKGQIDFLAGAAGYQNQPYRSRSYRILD